MRAGCFRALGREEEARQARRDSLRAAERRLQLHPDDVRAIYLGANALYELGERTRVLEWASGALFMDPEEPSVLYNVTCAYALLGETDKSRKVRTVVQFASAGRGRSRTDDSRVCKAGIRPACTRGDFPLPKLPTTASTGHGPNGSIVRLYPGRARRTVKHRLGADATGLNVTDRRGRLTAADHSRKNRPVVAPE